MGKITITPKGTLIGRAVILDKYCSNIIARSVFFLIWVLGLGSIVWLLGNAYYGGAGGVENYTELEAESGGLVSLAYAFFALLVTYLPVRMFYREKVKYPKTLPLERAKELISKSEQVNLYSAFSFELAKASATLFSAGGKVTTKDLMLALLNSKDMDFIMVRFGISKQELAAAFKKYPGEGRVGEIILKALNDAVLEKHHQIEVGDVFIALCEEDDLLKAILSDLKLDVKDVAHVVYWQTSIIRRFLDGRRFLDPRRFRMTGGIGRDWAYGYTPLLQQYSQDLTDAIRTYGLGLEIIGRENEIKEIEEALLRQNGGSVVLVGEKGIGKKTTVLGLAKKIAEGTIDERLAYQHVVEIRVDALLSGYKNQGDLVGRFTQLFNEVLSAGNMIVFIENIETLISGEGAAAVDLSDLLVKYLDVPHFHMIASTDVASFGSHIRTRSALLQRLTRVSVEESNSNETIRILEDVVPTIESKTKCLISYEAIKTAVKSADKYILDIPNPEKSIDLLDGTTARAASTRGRTLITGKDVLDYVTEKYKVPATEAGEDEKQKLVNIEPEMHKQVIGQNEAIKAIAGALRRVRAGVTDSKKPIGSFLFLGPTGVGKTETAKALAKAYFGNEERMIRFDMSEYQNKEDIYRFIGSNLGGANVQGSLTTAVREHPFSLILFDEIEKAHRDILDLFLQILDEGRLTDGFGRTVSFTNAIIICTSNAGANLIRESIQGGGAYETTKANLMNFLQKENVYRPEFLNRFTQVIVFSPLSREEVMQVASLMIDKLKKTVFTNRGVKLEVAPDALARLSELGFDPQMGARPMARVIQERVENFLANKILANELKEGDSITVSTADIG